MIRRAFLKRMAWVAIGTGVFGNPGKVEVQRTLLRPATVVTQGDTMQRLLAEGLMALRKDAVMPEVIHVGTRV